MTLYETLAQQFIADIRSQKLPIGSRLPALRVLAKQHQISMTTATKTYEYLQQAGYIFSQPQSGYFVASQWLDVAFPAPNLIDKQRRDPKQFAPDKGYSPTVAFFNPLGTCRVSSELQPLAELQRCIKRVTRRSESRLFQYPETQGDSRLRHALAQHFLQDHFPFSPNDCVITHGCIDSIRIAIESLTKAGDTVAISSPCFSGLLDLLAALSRNIIEIPYTSQGMDLVLLEKVMKQGEVQASLFSTTHINPTGQSLPVEQKQALVTLATKYQIPMIEDDVYFELSHQKHLPLPAKYWDKEGYVVWCGSVSKTLAAGLRLGWSLPGRYLTRYLQHSSHTCFGVNGLMQACLAEFMSTGEYRSHVNKIRLTLHHQVHAYRQYLIEHLPADALVSLPDGGLVLWVKIPSVNTQKLEQEAQTLHIDIRSGACFSTHDAYHDCFRINCGWSLGKKEADNTAFQQLSRLCELINEIKRRP